MKKSKKTTKEIGDLGEEAAVEFLEKQGFTVAARNFHSSYGELDIVAVKKGRFHICEVKTRSSEKFGFPEEYVSENKFKHLVETALYYFQTEEIDPPWQVDVIAVITGSGKPRLKYIENVRYD